jgi:hypothetical protein
VFYEAVPPGQVVHVYDVAQQNGGGYPSVILQRPDVTLYCETQGTCEGDRQFTSTTRLDATGNDWHNNFITYVCRNCSSKQKLYALRYKVWLKDGIYVAMMFKYGELPNFGPPTPAKLTRLLGTDKELFLKGRRAENQGMGIAAFAYYRRVIESQKDAIFDEIIRVSKGISADQAIITRLENAKKQVQFSSAVEELGDGVPAQLLINGHNPLTLMHGALSEGLHAKTDDECLTLATDLRIVLADFVERMSQAMKDNAELHSAVSRLMNRNQPKLASPATQNALPGS